MSHDNALEAYLNQGAKLDEFGRIIIEDPDLLAQINGAAAPDNLLGADLNCGSNNSNCNCA